MRKIPFLLAIVISLFVVVPTATQAETINTIPIDGYETTTTTTTTLPYCPPVYYDGVNPPVWATPDGLPPDYDCVGSGAAVVGDATNVEREPEVSVAGVVQYSPAFTG